MSWSTSQRRAKRPCGVTLHRLCFLQALRRRNLQRETCFHNLNGYHLMAVLGDPDNVEMNRKGCMGTMAIVTHAPQSTENLLKLPPKGGGFAPPNWRQ